MTLFAHHLPAHNAEMTHHVYHSSYDVNEIPFCPLVRCGIAQMERGCSQPVVLLIDLEHAGNGEHGVGEDPIPDRRKRCLEELS